jgi:MFS family permease
VITSDASSLQDRAIAFAFTASPYIITAFAGPKAAEGFYYEISWRWAFGVFAILLPFVAMPLFTVLTHYERKAKKLGLIQPRNTGRTILQSIWFYVVEFDRIYDSKHT